MLMKILLRTKGNRITHRVMSCVITIVQLAKHVHSSERSASRLSRSVN